jgi:hypothetical protein
MDNLANLHVRLKFNLSKEKGTNTTAKKNIMKLVKLQNLVAKCCKAWKIYPCKVCKFCICLYYVRKF